MWGLKDVFNFGKVCLELQRTSEIFGNRRNIQGNIKFKTRPVEHSLYFSDLHLFTINCRY